MPKLKDGDEVLVQGTALWMEAIGKFRIQFPGYPYPIPVRDEAIKEVLKLKPLRDVPD